MIPLSITMAILRRKRHEKYVRKRREFIRESNRKYMQRKRAEKRA